MPYANITGILAVFLIFGLPVLCVTLIVLTAVLRGGRPRKGQSRQQDDESRIIQEIYQGLNKLEKRIEDLETIMLQREFGKGASDEV